MSVIVQALFVQCMNGSYVRGLETLGITSEQYGSLLIPVIMIKFPSDICLRIAGQEGLEDNPNTHDTKGKGGSKRSQRRLYNFSVETSQSSLQRFFKLYC